MSAFSHSVKLLVIITVHQFSDNGDQMTRSFNENRNNQHDFFFIFDQWFNKFLPPPERQCAYDRFSHDLKSQNPFEGWTLGMLLWTQSQW